MPDHLRCLYGLVSLSLMLRLSSTADYQLCYIYSDTVANFNWTSNMAAIYMALDKLQEEEYLGKDTNISILTNKNGCSTASELMGTFEYLHFEHKIDGFIGHGCSRTLVYAGYLATHWNLAMLSQSSASPTLADRSLYPTLIRLLPSNNKLGLAMKEIIPYFGWKRIIMVYRSTSLCLYSANAIIEQMAEVGVTIIGDIGYGSELEDKVIDQTLAIIQRKARMLPTLVGLSMLTGIRRYRGGCMRNGHFALHHSETTIVSQTRIMPTCRWEVQTIIIFLCGTDEQEIRFMVRAHILGMTSSDYVYLTPTYQALAKPYRPWLNPLLENRTIIKQAMESLVQIATSVNEGFLLDEFHREFTERMAGPPWFVKDSKPSLFAATLYDAMYVYGLALNASLENGEDGRDGRQLIKRATNVTFEGMSGNIKFDQNAERDPTYTLYCLKHDHDSLTLFARVAPHLAGSQKFQLLEPDIWRTKDRLPPPDVPPCGFYGENCIPNDKSPFLTTIGVLITLLLLVILAVFLFWLIRRRHLERELQKMLWRISSDDLNILTGSQIGTNMSLACLKTAASKSIMWTNKSTKSLTGAVNQRTEENQLFTKVALYKGQVVAVKAVDISIINPSRGDKIEIKAIRDRKREHINTFLGACIDAPNVCVVTSYCARGSLQDILHNDNITLDDVFKESFIFDIIKAMCYLHASPVVSHGKLKTCNCVVDNRWVLKITDIDPSCLQRGHAHDAGEYEIYRVMLWTAPELLRNYGRPRGTPEGDVYSFGIIMQEIVFRALPFFMDVLDFSPKEIIERIRKPNGPGYRPKCPAADGVKSGMMNLMRSCWDETPANRPVFSVIKKVMQKLSSGKSLNIVDNMLHKLEVYAGNLETLVGGRTKELLEEKKKTDLLLHQMLPKSVVNQLKIGQQVRPEYVDEVTLYFSEIDDFLTVSLESSPMQIIHLLNSLYEMLDKLITTYDVYKVETIGDAYMVVSGLPTRNGRRHMTEIADMSLDILSSSIDFNISHLPTRKLKLRAGIHTGPCCAALRIHISQSTYQGLCAANEDYVMSLRGHTDIKGKGTQTTYWLEGRRGFTRPLPNAADF